MPATQAPTSNMSVCVCMCGHQFACACICAYAYAYVCVCMSARFSVCMRMYECEWAYMCVYVCACMCTSLTISIYTKIRIENACATRTMFVCGLCLCELLVCIPRFAPFLSWGPTTRIDKSGYVSTLYVYPLLSSITHYSCFHLRR